MAERNEKKKEEKKKICAEPGWATAQLSLRLGAGLGVAAGWARARLGVLGAQGTARRARQQARALGSAQGGRRAGASWLAVPGGRAGGRCARARGAQAGRRQRARQAQAWARGALGVSVRSAGRGREGLGPAGRAAWAWPGRSLCARAGPAWPGWGFVHSDSVFLARFDSVVS